MASSSSSPAIKDGECINWVELPPELTSSILQRLGVVEILENAQKVCKSWRRVCKDPSMWRKIDMHNPEDLGDLDYDVLEKMCRHAVDRSQGGLNEINIWDFATDDLLSYIADSSSKLRSLKLVMCDSLTSQGIMEALMKLPLLEDLEVSYCSLSGESLKVVGRSCPNLKTLKKNCVGYRRPRLESDDDALAIAETMPGLRHLQLFGNRITNVGLNVILDNCPNLEHLDLRQCFNLKLVGDLEKRCAKRIKVVRFPNDSTSDYQYDATVDDLDSSEDDYHSSEDDYPYGFSDVDMMSEADFYDDLGGHSDYDPLDYYDDFPF